VIAGIILAAGASSRMGSPKALLEYRGETFAGRLVRVLSKVCNPVIVVLGYHAAAIRERVTATVVINPDPDRGQLSSLQCALAAVPPDADGFLFTPVDCPTVDEKTLADLVRILGKCNDAIVIPRFEGRRGHPVCVSRSLMPAFLSLAPTEQTRNVVNQHADRVIYFDVIDPGVLADIDDPEAYRALAQ